MFYVYILESKVNSSYYVGSSKNIEKRLVLHNKGLVQSTKKYLPWSLVHVEEFVTLKLARRRELQIKAWKKRNEIEKLINHFKNL